MVGKFTHWRIQFEQIKTRANKKIKATFKATEKYYVTVYL